MPGIFKAVILLRRHKKDLTEEEKSILETAFGMEIIYVPTDPADAQEHLTDCERLKPTAILTAAKERAILAKAMDAGFQHVTIIPGGESGSPAELVPLELGPPVSKRSQ